VGVEDFELVQRRLSNALVANTAGSGIDHVMIALASYSVGESLLSHYVDRIPAMEHRYLHSQTVLNRIEGCECVFVCSQAPEPEVLAYYQELVAPHRADAIRAKVRCIVVGDRSARSLSAKLLDRPDLLDELRRIVGDRPALIEPWNVTPDEVAVACAIGVPINGSDPSLRPAAFKSAGRHLFEAAGVATPVGCEHVRDVTGVVEAVRSIRMRRPGVRKVVVKHDDSGAGDGNAVIRVVDAGGAPLGDEDVTAAVLSLPDWYLSDLTAGGIVEELIEADEVRSPSVQVDMHPDGSARVLATHDQIVGGDNGQVYLGCRFPADPGYAGELGRVGAAVGAHLGRLGAVGRASVDTVAACQDQRWDVLAIEINLRKGGTTHPFSALRNLVPGRYDPDEGQWLADADGEPRAYRSTDNVVDPAWTGRTPASVIRAIRDAGLQFDPTTGRGVVLHMLSCLAVDGRFGATAIASSRDEADAMFAAAIEAVDA
jgi:hypothetical protein